MRKAKGRKAKAKVKAPASSGKPEEVRGRTPFRSRWVKTNTEYGLPTEYGPRRTLYGFRKK